MSKSYLLSATSRILILLLFCTLNNSVAQNKKPTSCPSSSCGNITSIRYPFRLRGSPSSCGYNDPNFELACQNNHTILRSRSRNFCVQEIDYDYYSIRLVDPNIQRQNLSSCPVYPNGYDDWSSLIFDMFFDWNLRVAFIHCLNPVNSSSYVSAPFCGNRSNIFSNSSETFSYIMVGDGVSVSDLEDSCTVDRVDWASARRAWRDNSSLPSIYDGLAYGFELSWFRVFCGECERTYGTCSLEGKRVRCRHYCSEGGPGFKCEFEFWAAIVAYLAAIIVGGILGLRFLCGFPFLVGLVIHKWRKRNVSSMDDETIEEFFQVQNHLMPIKYTYSEIKKMTNNFNKKLGEGLYGSVYKGKLRSGPYAAIKMTEQDSIASRREFINKIRKIGQIRHVNVVQLIGFCLEGSKCGLVYEFLPNGSLDKYIFSQEASALRYEKMFEIALGVARGIDYLHRGCDDMKISHFDIRPHNILLDENFNPKISDSGLSEIFPTEGSIVNLTGARGTMGYLAPEMFYKNVIGVSFSKADVYSFGMMLMDMVASRSFKNASPSWIYDQIYAGKEIETRDATEEERKTVKKIVIVAFWCMQTKPSDRPSMNRVVEMLEGDSELQIPPKTFSVPGRETAEDREISEISSP